MDRIFLFIYDLTFGGLGLSGALTQVFGVDLWRWWDYYRFFAFFFSSFCFIVAVIYLYKLRELRSGEYAEAKQAEGVIAASQPARQNDDWERIQKLMSSSNQSDWKVAVLEADKMLDQVVSGLGYQGEDLGAKLMSVRRENFQTLEDAWQAHKFRNRIAHTPKLDLERPQFEEAINNFEKVFREFDFI